MLTNISVYLCLIFRRLKFNAPPKIGCFSRDGCSSTGNVWGDFNGIRPKHLIFFENRLGFDSPYKGGWISEFEGLPKYI